MMLKDNNFISAVVYLHNDARAPWSSAARWPQSWTQL